MCIRDSKYPRWLRSGGDATLQSFGCTFFQEIPEKYQTFFHDTLHYYETEKYIFVHAGLNFLNEDIFEDKTAMLWIRDFDAMQPKLGNKRLIHGHTPKSMTHIIQQKGNCFNIDGGCVYPVSYTHLDVYKRQVLYNLYTPEDLSII